MSPRYRYRWPASAITSEEMALLYQAREAGPRQPITRLIARAIRQTYGSVQSSTDPIPIHEDKKEAA
jgi:hypothetical protein